MKKPRVHDEMGENRSPLKHVIVKLHNIEDKKKSYKLLEITCKGSEIITALGFRKAEQEGDTETKFQQRKF